MRDISSFTGSNFINKIIEHWSNASGTQTNIQIPANTGSSGGSSGGSLSASVAPSTSAPESTTPPTAGKSVFADISDCQWANEAILYL